jgi:hypothetical protein
MKLTATTQPNPVLWKIRPSWNAHRIICTALAEMEAEYYRLCWRDEHPGKAYQTPLPEDAVKAA